MTLHAPLKVLIAGFGPFPGVPRNPSGEAARRLAAFRRPALSGLARDVMLLPTQWSSLADLDTRIRAMKPDAVLLLGVAPRRRRIEVETRAVNQARGLDAARRRMPGRTFEAGGVDAHLARPAPTALVHALRGAGLKAGLSRDAGRYLCNGAYYTALAHGGIPTVFIHLPGKGAQARADRRKVVFALSQALLALLRTGEPGGARP